MANYKNILVAVDSSDEAVQVLAKAAEIAEKNNAEVSVLHVLELPVVGYGELMAENLVLSEQSIYEAVYPKIVAYAEQVNLAKDSVSVLTGRAINVIVEQAENLAIDLIVTGTHGRHGLQLLLGSTANGILHHAKCDVLSVRVKS